MIARNRVPMVASSACRGPTDMVGDVGAVRPQTQYPATPNRNTALTFAVSCTRPVSGRDSGQLSANPSVFLLQLASVFGIGEMEESVERNRHRLH
jgi:hypothetical protein